MHVNVAFYSRNSTGVVSLYAVKYLMHLFGSAHDLAVVRPDRSRNNDKEDSDLAP